MLRCASPIKAREAKSFSVEERSLQVALHSRGQPTGACICHGLFLPGLALVLFGGTLSRSQEARPQKADLTSSPEVQRGIDLAQKGDLKGAEGAFVLAVALHPHDPRALTALGQVQERLGKLPE